MGENNENKRSVSLAFYSPLFHHSNIPCGVFHHSMWTAQIDRGKKPMISIYCRNSEAFFRAQSFLFQFSRDVFISGTIE